MSTKKKVLLVLIPAFLVLMIGFGLTTTARAVEFDEDGLSEAGEVIDDDLFISAETVEIRGTVKGDVLLGERLSKSPERSKAAWL